MLQLAFVNGDPEVVRAVTTTLRLAAAASTWAGTRTGAGSRPKP
jgi:hypothetical protein